MIFGINYNWHTHPQVGEVYHHYYVGEEYDAPDWQHKAKVVFIEELGDKFRICFDNLVDIFQSNVNKVIIVPNEKASGRSGGDTAESK
jgi:hypothetical protein